MISPSLKLKKLVDLYETRADFCRRTEIDETIMLKLLSGERGASSTHIEKVLKQTGWKFEEAWDIAEGENKE